MELEVNSTPERSNSVFTVFDQSYSTKNVNKAFVVFRNDLLFSKGRQVNGWKAAGIVEALKEGADGLKPLDPFAMIDPLDTSTIRELFDQNLDEKFVSPRQDDDDSDDDLEDMDDSDVQKYLLY